VGRGASNPTDQRNASRRPFPSECGYSRKRFLCYPFSQSRAFFLSAYITQMWLETYQIGKDFQRRGIVEVIIS
jgi:hypothetical protein